jgi:hypothetical protein
MCELDKALDELVTRRELACYAREPGGDVCFRVTVDGGYMGDCECRGSLSESAPSAKLHKRLVQETDTQASPSLKTNSPDRSKAWRMIWTKL